MSTGVFSSGFIVGVDGTTSEILTSTVCGGTTAGSGIFINTAGTITIGGTTRVCAKAFANSAGPCSGGNAYYSTSSHIVPNIIIQDSATIEAEAFSGITFDGFVTIQNGGGNPSIESTAFGWDTTFSTGTASPCGVCRFNAPVTISGGTFDAPANNAAFSGATFGAAATLQITGGTFNSASTPNNRPFFGTFMNASVTINGGIFNAPTGILAFFGVTNFFAPVQIISMTSSAVANECFFDSIFQVAAPLTITGGSFDATAANFVFFGVAFKAPVAISGISSTSSGVGTVNESFLLSTYTAAAPLTIHSGTFSGFDTFAFASIVTNALLTIEGGTFTGTDANGSFSCTNLGNSVYKEIHISGGTFGGSAGADVEVFSLAPVLGGGTANPISTGLCISGGAFTSCAFQNLALSGYLSISGGTFTGTSTCTSGFFTVDAIDPTIAVCVLKGVSYPSNMFYSSGGGCSGVSATHTLCRYLGSSSDGTTITCTGGNPCSCTPSTCPLLQNCCSCPLPGSSLALTLTDLSCPTNANVKVQVTGGTSGTTCAASGSLCSVTGSAAGVYCVCITNDLTNVTTCQCTNTSGMTTFNGLSPLTPYTVTATDAASNTRSCFVTTIAPLTAACSHINVSTNGLIPGSVTVVVSGGTPGACTALCATPTCVNGYCVELKNSASVTVGKQCACSPLFTVTFPGLGADTYTATVTDFNLCTTTCSTTVLAPVNRGGTSSIKALAEAAQIGLPDDVVIWTLETDPPANPILGGGVPLICCTPSVTGTECSVFDFTSIATETGTIGNAAGLVCGGDIDCTGCPGGTAAVVSCFDIGIKIFDPIRRCWSLHALGEVGVTIPRPCRLFLTAGSWIPSVSSVGGCPLITPVVPGGTVFVEILTALDAIINCFTSCSGLCAVDNGGAFIPDTLVDVSILTYAFYKSGLCENYFDAEGNPISSAGQFVRAVLGGEDLTFVCTPPSNSGVCGCLCSNETAVTVNLCNFPCLASRLICSEKIKNIAGTYCACRPPRKGCKDPKLGLL